MGKRLLITGAGGFIGRRCIAPAIAPGFAVHTLERRACDLLRDDVAPLVARVRPTHLLHLAWITTPGEYRTSPLNEALGGGELRVVDAFVKAGGRRIVATGTCAEYDWSSGRCIEDKTPLSDASPYSVAKNAVRTYLESNDVDAAWARVFFAYGPGEARQRLVSSIALNLLAGESATCSEGKQQRDFIHVDDIAAALVALLDSDVRGPINIGTGQATAIRDVVETLGGITGRADLLRFGAPANEPPLVVADVTRLRDEVGFTPRHDIASGLRDTVAALKGGAP